MTAGTCPKCGAMEFIDDEGYLVCDECGGKR